MTSNFVPAYSPWRHGGWYVDNVRYPSGAVGCVSRNYPDRKWRIVCDERPDAYERHTYPSRDAAARAEHELAQAQTAARATEVAGQLARFDVYPPEPNGREGHCLFCGGYVPAGNGLICLGHDNGGTFAAPLHKHCGDLVDAEHKRQRAEREADANPCDAPEAGQPEPDEAEIREFRGLCQQVRNFPLARLCSDALAGDPVALVRVTSIMRGRGDPGIGGAKLTADGR